MANANPPSMGRRVVGVLLGLVMLGWGITSIVRGVGEMHGHTNALLDRPLPAPGRPRAWEQCTPDETSYASAQPVWTPRTDLEGSALDDMTAAWTPRERGTAVLHVYPMVGITEGPAPRDCAPSGGAVFRRFASNEDLLALGNDDAQPAMDRVAAVAAGGLAVAPMVLTYCRPERIDDYQWECARLRVASLQLSATVLRLENEVMRTLADAESNAHVTHGLQTSREATVGVIGDLITQLEAPSGVRPGVRALIARSLAEDLPHARAELPDQTPIVPMRARVVALAAQETQPDVQAALTAAIAVWPAS